MMKISIPRNWSYETEHGMSEADHIEHPYVGLHALDPRRGQTRHLHCFEEKL